MSLQFSVAAKKFAARAVRTMPRRLVLQKMPSATDGHGYPQSTYVDIDPTHPIPCLFTMKSGHEMVLSGASKTVTLYNFEIPQLNYYDGIWANVDFSTKYRVHLLPNNDQDLEDLLLQIIGGGGDDDPILTFQAVTLDDLLSS